MVSSEKVYDYLARQQIEGGGKVWLGNRAKILYVFKRAKKYLKPGMHVCEIGIGEGYLLLLLRSLRLNLKITGIDISEYLIHKLMPLKDLGINLLKHDISKPINENMNCRFDVVFALDVLEHVEALEAAIENIGKLLKPNGLLIATLRWKENMADNYGICPFVIMYSTGGVTSIPFTSWATSLRCLKKNSISLNLTLYFWELKENLWRF